MWSPCVSLMESEAEREGNPSADVSGQLPPKSGTSRSGGGESNIVVENSDETVTDTMGLSTGDRGKQEAQVDIPWPENTAGELKRTNVSSPAKLCGYLQKQAGPLRAWKSRWFVYDEKKCQLFYYRTPEDLNPLGKAELSNATFSYPLRAEEGTFHINTPERTFILKAPNREGKMYWLQQLQLRRWQRREQLTADSILTPQDPDGQQLLDTSPVNFLPAVSVPPGVVGEETARLRVQANLINFSLKHPIIELQNLHSWFTRRSSLELGRSLFSTDGPTTSTETPKTETSKTSSANLNNITVSTAQAPPQSQDPSPELGSEKQQDSLHPPGSPLLLPNGKKKKGNSAAMSKEANAPDEFSDLRQQNFTLAEEVKAQKELVWLLHKALEAAQLEKRTCAQFLATEGEQERLELLRCGERSTADLRERLERLQQEKEALQENLAERDAHIAELQENVKLLLEKNHAKQQVITKLSEQVAAYDADPRRSVPSDCFTFKQLVQEMDGVKDDIEAYKTQNKFLNSEIHQLTRLWRNSSEREKSLMMKCACLEASSCQMESRYLGVLRKLQENKELNVEQRDAVRRIIEEALQPDLKNVTQLDSVRDHDQYGFKIIPVYEVADMKLLAKMQVLEIRSHNLLNQDKFNKTALARWTQYLGGRSPDDLSPSMELKYLVRGGIPSELRPRVWRWMVWTRTRTLREKHPDLFQQMCEKSQTSPHPASRQIQLDLHRTLTSNQHFSSPSSPALQQLHRVLLAFAWQNPTVGYCQGLNRLAAIALLVLQNEEEAFWCLVAIVQFLMPQDYYTKTLLASQADQRVLKDFMMEKVPRLMSHLEELSVDVSLITFNWFLVVFVESLPSDILFKVWDAFFYEGSKVIFRYALALFKHKEEDLLKIHDSVEMYQYLRFFTKTVADGRKLTSIAFLDMNPFPKKLVMNRQTQHLQRLQAELRELEKLQKEYASESSQRKGKDLDEEDDDDT